MASTVTVTQTCGKREFTFEMNLKRVTLGDIAIDHFWIPSPQLNPRKEPAPESTYRTFCEGFRTICMTDVSDLEMAAEVYVLARLRPHTRSRRASSIFLDAKESSVAHKKLKGHDVDLQSMLTTDPLLPMTAAEFYKALFGHQQLRAYTDEEWELYKRMQKELLGDVPELWLYGNRPDIAYETVLQRWKEMQLKFGRRGGCEGEKTILNAISYEAAAAFRRCYSAVWNVWILPALQNDPVRPLSRHSYRFLEYWHQQIGFIDRSAPDRRDFPFHGHCLGLHPAAGRFLKTPRGRELVGAWLEISVKTGLANQQNLPEFGRMLRGYYLAYLHYTGQRDEANSNRPPSRRPR